MIPEVWTQPADDYPTCPTAGVPSCVRDLGVEQFSCTCRGQGFCKETVWQSGGPGCGKAQGLSDLSALFVSLHTHWQVSVVRQELV